MHLSKETADLLIKAGKESWIEPRVDLVEAKGKGKLQTYWLKKNFKRAGTRSTESDHSQSSSSPESVAESASPSEDLADKTERTNRLISWNVETLLALLKHVIVHRNARTEAGKRGTLLTKSDTDQTVMNGISDCLGEVREIIALPEYDSTVASLAKDVEKVHVSREVKNEMRAFVGCVASMYRENAFHNFEHAR